jgi:predicted transposase/invertase (TIGR01784 family)
VYDDVCKYIAEKFSADLTGWLLGESIELTVLEPTELQVAPIRADSIIFLQSQNLILHLEFQTRPREEIPFRMADYRLRIYRRFGPIRTYQVVIYLRETDSELARIDSFDISGLGHRFEVIRLWEIPAEELLQSPGLLPFAVLGQTDDREGF